MKSKIKVLVVDDDPFVRQSLKTLLDSWGVEVVEAQNSEETLRQVKQNSLSAILLDIRLGNEDGLILLKAIRVLNNTLPVVVMTAYPNEYSSGRFLEHFFDPHTVDFLTKPVQSSELKEALKIPYEEEAQEALV